MILRTIFLIGLFCFVNYASSQEFLFYYDQNNKAMYTIGNQYKIKLIYDGLPCSKTKIVGDSVTITKTDKCEYVLRSQKKTEGILQLYIVSEIDNRILDSLTLANDLISNDVEFDIKYINKDYLDGPYQTLDFLGSLELKNNFPNYLSLRNELKLEIIKFTLKFFDKSGKIIYSAIKSTNEFSNEEKRIFKNLKEGESISISEVDFYISYNEKSEKGHRNESVYRYIKHRTKS